MNKESNEITGLIADRSDDMMGAYCQLLSFLFAATLVVVFIIGGPLLYMDIVKKFDVPFLPLVALCGALGAFFSALMRLYSIEQLPAALVHRDLKKLRNVHLLIYSMIPPLTGMIGAAVLYVAIAGGMVDGVLFQEFKCRHDSGACDSLSGLLNYGPKDVVDYAKALVWGFAAGFSERLVPDAMGRFAKATNSQNGI